MYELIAAPQHRPRRAAQSGRVVLHVSASPMARGAAPVVNWMRTDPAPHSYHEIAGVDRAFLLLPDEVEAFGALGGVNRDAWHICIAANPSDFTPDDPRTRDLIGWMGQRIAAYWRRRGFDRTQPKFIAAAAGPTFGLIHHGDLQGDRSDAWASHPRRAELDAMLLDAIKPQPSPTRKVSQRMFTITSKDGRPVVFRVLADGTISYRWRQPGGSTFAAPIPLAQHQLPGSPAGLGFDSITGYLDSSGRIVLHASHCGFPQWWWCQETEPNGKFTPWGPF